MNAGASGTTSGRDAYHHLFEDTLNWQRARTASTSAARSRSSCCGSRTRNVVPELRFDVVQGDPSGPDVRRWRIFRALQRPTSPTRAGCSAILTGRISEVRGVARLDPATNKYIYLGQGDAAGRGSAQVGLWLQDSWHVRPEPDGELRRPLRPAVPVRRARTTATRSATSTTCTACSGRGQPLQTRRANRPGRRRSGNWRQRRARVSRWTGTTSRRASGSRGHPRADDGWRHAHDRRYR